MVDICFAYPGVVFFDEVAAICACTALGVGHPDSFACRFGTASFADFAFANRWVTFADAISVAAIIIVVIIIVIIIVIIVIIIVVVRFFARFVSL